MAFLCDWSSGWVGGWWEDGSVSQRYYVFLLPDWIRRVRVCMYSLPSGSPTDTLSDPIYFCSITPHQGNRQRQCKGLLRHGPLYRCMHSEDDRRAATCIEEWTHQNWVRPISISLCFDSSNFPRISKCRPCCSTAAFNRPPSYLVSPSPPFSSSRQRMWDELMQNAAYLKGCWDFNCKDLIDRCLRQDSLSPFTFRARWSFFLFFFFSCIHKHKRKHTHVDPRTHTHTQSNEAWGSFFLAMEVIKKNLQVSVTFLALLKAIWVMNPPESSSNNNRRIALNRLPHSYQQGPDPDTDPCAS